MLLLTGLLTFNHEYATLWEDIMSHCQAVQSSRGFRRIEVLMMSEQHKDRKMRGRNRRLGLLIALVLLSILITIVGGTFLFRDEASGYTQNVPGKGLVPSVTPTPSIQPTASLTPEPIFTDDFMDDKKGWYTGDAAGYTRLINADGLLLADTNHQILVESLPSSGQFSDCSVITTFTLVSADKNDGVGLYVRGDSNLDHDYRIEIFGDGTFAISKESLDADNEQEVTFLVPPTHTPLLKPPGKPNTLDVTLNGADLTLSINGRIASQTSDADYTRGQIALFVSNGQTSSGVEALFSSIAIYPLRS
jgi:hypothetical protein